MAFGAETSSFSVNIIGDKTGQQWTGEFTVKSALSHRETFLRDLRRREHLGPVNPDAADPYAANAAEVFAEMAIRVVKAPSWWTESGGGLDLIDVNIVSEVYKLTMEVESASLTKVRAAAEKAREELIAAAKAAETK